jgi:hypothetical protein
VAPPAGLAEDDLRALLGAAAAAQGVDVALQPLDADAL